VRNAANQGRLTVSDATPSPAAPTRSGLIFAGGRATRLGGTNKALLDVDGQRIIDRILAALAPLVDECVVLANDPALEGLPNVRLVFDPTPHAGVLRALAAGLTSARGELCLAVACDMPFVSTALFRHQLELLEASQVDVVIPRTDEFLEPMHAVYRRATVLHAIDAAIARGQQRMNSYFADVQVAELPEADWAVYAPGGEAFFNVNTPADLEAARALARSRKAPDAPR
jgi:molybdopterin-guanine dinucleotide biosynthesis protein A